MIRIFIAILGLVGALCLPPYVPLICIALLSLRYAAWEAVIIGLCMDFLWLPHDGISIPFFTIASLVIVWGLQPLRNELMAS